MSYLDRPCRSLEQACADLGRDPAEYRLRRAGPERQREELLNAAPSNSYEAGRIRDAVAAVNLELGHAD